MKTSLPGQYVTVKMRMPDGIHQPRQYSLIRADDGEHRSFAVKRVPGNGKPPGEMSNLLHDTVGVLQLVFASVAGAGALVALIVAYRRQRVAETGLHTTGPAPSTRDSPPSPGSSAGTRPPCGWPGCMRWPGWLTTGRKTGRPASMSCAPIYGCL